MGVLVLLDDRVQDRRYGTGLAGPSGTNDSEMLAKEVIDQEERRDVGILMDRTDRDGGVARRCLDLFQILRTCQIDRIIESGESGNAAPKTDGPAAGSKVLSPINSISMIFKSSSAAVTLGTGTRSPLIMLNTVGVRVLIFTKAASSNGLRE